MFPSLSVTAMPSMSSVCLIKGILIQLAAATAVKGTHLFTTGGALCVNGQDASDLYTPSLDNIWLQFVHSSARILPRVYYYTNSSWVPTLSSSYIVAPSHTYIVAPSHSYIVAPSHTYVYGCYGYKPRCSLLWM